MASLVAEQHQMLQAQDEQRVSEEAHRNTGVTSLVVPVSNDAHGNVSSGDIKNKGAKVSRSNSNIRARKPLIIQSSNVQRMVSRKNEEPDQGQYQSRLLDVGTSQSRLSKTVQGGRTAASQVKIPLSPSVRRTASTRRRQQSLEQVDHPSTPEQKKVACLVQESPANAGDHTPSAVPQKSDMQDQAEVTDPSTDDVMSDDSLPDFVKVDPPVPLTSVLHDDDFVKVDIVPT